LRGGTAVDWAICPIVLTTSKPRRGFAVVVLRICVIALLRIAAAHGISAGTHKTAAAGKTKYPKTCARQCLVALRQTVEGI
jgi:hypothetical protein